MASSPIRVPQTHSQILRRAKSLQPTQSRQYVSHSSPGPSRFGFRLPRSSSLAVGPDAAADHIKKQRLSFSDIVEKWHDRDSDDGESVDLETMTLHHRDGTSEAYDPRDQVEADEEEAGTEDDASSSDEVEVYADGDEFESWTEREIVASREEVSRIQARTVRSRLQMSNLGVEGFDDEELLQQFKDAENQRRAKSSERGLSTPLPDDEMDHLDAESSGVFHRSNADHLYQDAAPMSDRDVAEIIAQAKRLRQGREFLPTAFAVSLSPESSPPRSSVPLPPTVLSASSTMPEPAKRSYWRTKLPERTRETPVRSKGKDRMLGERASDSLSAARDTVNPQPTDGGRHRRGSSPKPVTTDLAGDEINTDDLDPHYYRVSTYTYSGKEKLRTCRLCRRAGGERSRLAAHCRGCVSFKDCRFSDHQNPVSEGGADSAVDADLDDTPATKVKTKRKIKRRPNTPKPTHPVDTDTESALTGVTSNTALLIGPTPDPTVPAAYLDKKLYFRSLLKQPVGDGHRMCPICARAEGQQRRLSFWCRGRISFRDCGFYDGDEQAYLNQLRLRRGKRAKSEVATSPMQAKTSPLKPSKRVGRLSLPNKATSSPYHPGLHQLHNGGYMHCKVCRQAGGERAAQSGYCKGRMGVRLCAFEHQQADQQAKGGTGALRATTTVSPLPSQQPDSGATLPSKKRKIARPRPKPTQTHSVPPKRPKEVAVDHASSPILADLSAHKVSSPAFDIVIPIRARASKTPDSRPQPAVRLPDTPVSPEIRPQHLNFGRPRHGRSEPEVSRLPVRSSPLPPSSPPSEPKPRARPVRPLPLSARPTPPDSDRDRSTQTPMGREFTPLRQPVKSALRQSSEFSETPRSVKRARFSMPLSPSSDLGEGQPSFTILRPRSQSFSDHESHASDNDKSDSSDDDGFLLVPPSARSRSTSARPANQHDMWSSSPAKRYASVSGDRLPFRPAARHSSTFEDRSRSSPSLVSKSRLMPPPPVPMRPSPLAQTVKTPRSEPRQSVYQSKRPIASIPSSMGPRAKSLAAQIGDQRHIPAVSRSHMFTLQT